MWSAAVIIAVSVFTTLSSPAVASGVSDTLGSCDPIEPSQCMYPFPNNFWLRGSPALTNFSDSTFPIDNLGKPVRADYGGWNGRDGFSPMGPIQTYFPDASLDGCARLWDIAFSTSASSSWVILDTVTNKTVPHWVELDHNTLKGETKRAFILWPASRLTSGRRYIVAARNLVTTSGAPVTESDAFKALRDGSASTDPNVNLRRQHFASIFANLKAAGVEQSTLNIAWDFTVASQKQLTGSMVHMRDDALSRLSTFSYAIDKVTDNCSTDIAREVQGHFMVPWYLNSPGLFPDFYSRLSRGSDGLPEYQSMQPVNFTVRIPWSLTTANHTPGRIVQYGHGLFGEQTEVRAGYLGEEANKYGYVYIAVDWIGLSQWDAISVALMLGTDGSNFAMVPDRCHQGMLNALASMRFAITTLVKDPMLNFHGIPAFNSQLRNYAGNSQGGILGTVYMALSTDVTRGCIGVGGGPYSILLPRSKDFAQLGDVLKLRYRSDLDRASLMPVFQLLWDTLEPSGYIDAISLNLLPNTPKHNVIMHYGLGDEQVSWLGMHLIARSTDAHMFAGNVKEGNETLYGFPFENDTAVLTDANLVQGYDYGLPVVPFVNTPPTYKTDAHEFPRRTPSAQQQMHTFFTTGNIVNYCKGPCVQPIPSFDSDVTSEEPSVGSSSVAQAAFSHALATAVAR